MKHVVLVFFDDDADPADVERFLDEAPECVAGGPFLSQVSGPSLRATKTSSDWGFVAEIDDVARVQEWIDCEPHMRMIELSKRVVARTASFQVG